MSRGSLLNTFLWTTIRAQLQDALPEPVLRTYLTLFTFTEESWRTQQFGCLQTLQTFGRKYWILSCEMGGHRFYFTPMMVATLHQSATLLEDLLPLCYDTEMWVNRHVRSAWPLVLRHIKLGRHAEPSRAKIQALLTILHPPAYLPDVTDSRSCLEITTALAPKTHGEYLTVRDHIQRATTRLAQHRTRGIPLTWILPHLAAPLMELYRVAFKTRLEKRQAFNYMWNCAENTNKVHLWRSAGMDFLDFLVHHFQSLWHPIKRTHRTSKAVAPRCFLVYLSHMQVEPTSHPSHTLLRFTIPSHTRVFHHAVRTSYYQSLQTQSDQAFVFILPESVLLHPFLQARNYQNRRHVSTFKWGTFQSHGLLIPWESILCFVHLYQPNMLTTPVWDEHAHGKPLPLPVGCRRANRQPRLVLRRQQLQHCILTQASLHHLSPLVKHFTAAQRKVLAFVIFTRTPLGILAEWARRTGVQTFTAGVCRYLLHHLSPSELKVQLGHAGCHERFHILLRNSITPYENALLHVQEEAVPIHLLEQAYDMRVPIEPIFRALKRLEQPFSAVAGADATFCWSVLHQPGWPTTFYRLFWQCVQYAPRHTLELDQVPDWSALALSESLLQTPISLRWSTHTFEHHVCLQYDMARHHLVEVPDHMEEYHSLEVTMQIYQEEVRGISVFQTAMDDMWSFSLRPEVGLFLVYQDGTIGPSHLLSSTELATFPLTISTYQFMYQLGLVTALALSEGLFLPYPLAPDVWHFLWSPLLTPFSLPPQPNNFFYHRTMESYHALEKLTSVELQAAFCLESPLTLGEIMQQHFLPQQGIFQAFKDGFATMIPYGLPNHIAWANELFSTPITSSSSPGHSLWYLDSQDDPALATLWRDFLAQLTPEEYVQLLHFVTGKRRIPLEAWGEPPLSVSWSDTSGLPRAQNCTHQLFIPCQKQLLQQPPGEARTRALRTLFTPIFSFDTTYGFL